MKRKLLRMISNLAIDPTTNNLIYEQKSSPFYILGYGLISLFFRKKDKTICPVNAINLIETSSTVMTGRLITVYTDQTKYVLEVRSRETWQILCDKLPSLLPNVRIKSL